MARWTASQSYPALPDHLIRLASRATFSFQEKERARRAHLHRQLLLAGKLFHGSITFSPAAAKALTSREATANPREAAMAAM